LHLSGLLRESLGAFVSLWLTLAYYEVSSRILRGASCGGDLDQSPRRRLVIAADMHSMKMQAFAGRAVI
jgi:hypothetical protein